MEETKRKIVIKDVVDAETSKGKSFYKVIDKYNNEFSVWDDELAAELLSLKNCYIEISYQDDKWKTINSVTELSQNTKQSKKIGEPTTLLKGVVRDTRQTSIESQCALKSAVTLICEFKDFLYENPEDFKWGEIVDLACDTQQKLLDLICVSDNPEDDDDEIYSTDDEMDELFSDVSPPVKKRTKSATPTTIKKRF